MNKVPTINMEKTGKNITHLRKEAGLRVRDIQDIMGFESPQAIYKWEAGYSMPKIDNFIILSKMLQVSINDILVTDEREIKDR